VCRSRRDASKGARVVVIAARVIVTLIAACGSRRDASRGARLVVIAVVVIAMFIAACRSRSDASKGARLVVIAAVVVATLIAVSADRPIMCVHALVARARHVWVGRQKGQWRRKNTDGGSNVPSEARWEIEGQNAS
jgi:hypothetical protein